ncbi:MAG TPA: hypothetical protein VFQ07_11275 [Candidatus Polarisedimenticolia bacterium]|nr:hypothetical protein [Candidatus Polarisedimenticolia bacterium]
MKTRPASGMHFAVALSICLLAAPAAAAFAGGDVNFLLGFKPLDKNDWGPVEDQGAFGAEVTFGRETWPVWIAIDYFATAAVEERVPINVGGFVTSGDITGTTFELDFGLRKIWGRKKTRPFFGAGVGVVGATYDADVVDDSDQTAAVWAGGGVFWRLGRRFNLGGSVRWSDAQVTLFDNDVQAGGLTYGLLLGWGWPPRT